MYDITSTYFEGQAESNPMAQRGYSRDNRSDCKQVCIGLVVSRCGMPLGYEVFAGNTADVTTVERIVETMESRYGKSDRIQVMDRGMVSEDNIAFLLTGGRRYIVGTPKTMLKQFEAEVVKDDWNTIRDGLEVKLCPRPRKASDDDTETPGSDEELFILCRSRDRSQKEEAMVRRSEEKIAERLQNMQSRCEKQKRDPMPFSFSRYARGERAVGRLLGQNTRAARLFQVTVTKGDDGFAKLEWKKVQATRDWATLSADCYLLRTNVLDWTDEELWKAYIQLTEAEAAFGIQKSDLKIRPIWHQKEERVLAHIFVCFLAYVLWKTLSQLCERAGLGNSARRVLAELGELRMMDVVLPTRDGLELRCRCLSTPSDHQQILLDQPGLRLPRINQSQM
jgi:transposase